QTWQREEQADERPEQCCRYPAAPAAIQPPTTPCGFLLHSDGQSAVTLLSIKHKNIRVALSNRMNSKRQCLEIRRQLELIGYHHIAPDPVCYFQIPLVGPMSRRCGVHVQIRSTMRIFLTVESHFPLIPARRK